MSARPVRERLAGVPPFRPLVGEEIAASRGGVRGLLAVCMLALLAVVGATDTRAQTQLTENTLRLEPGAPPVAASIDQLSWLAGAWRGEGLGGTVEEIWSDPSAGVMMGAFQLNREGKPGFYEFLLIGEGVPQEGAEQDADKSAQAGFALRLKHFNPDFVGWEEKADFVTFPLVKLEPKAAYFQGLTYRLVDDELHIFLSLTQGEKRREVPFVLKRLR